MCEIFGLMLHFIQSSIQLFKITLPTMIKTSDFTFCFRLSWKLMKDKRYDELDVLRGFAALFVLFFHLTLFRNEAK